MFASDCGLSAGVASNVKGESGATAVYGPGWLPIHTATSTCSIQCRACIRNCVLLDPWAIAHEAQEGTQSHSAGVVPGSPGTTPGSAPGKGVKKPPQGLKYGPPASYDSLSNVDFAVAGL